MHRVILFVVALLVVTLVPPAVAQDGPPEVLAWTGTYGFRHPSITDAQLALNEMAGPDTFNVTITENPADLNAANLADYDALMWVSTTGKPPMTEQQRAEVIRYAGCGGGTVGFHAVLDSNYGWAEHAELFGAQFDSHPQNAGDGEARMIVEDDSHVITEGWQGQESFMFDDEYYRWRSAKGIEGVSNPRNFGDTHVLLSLDETTVREGIQEGPTPYEHHQPIAWTKTFRDGGRVYYNNMGHSSGTWSLPEFRTALINGVGWVSEVELDTDCLFGDEPLPPAPTPPAATPALVEAECALPELQIRENGTWEQSGAAKALTVDGDSMALAAGLPGGFQWGAQTYILDLAGTGAAAADVTFTLTWSNPADDYDLSVTTAWGWYGEDTNTGVTTEELTIEGAPNCAYLHVAGDSLVATGTSGPTLTAAVVPRDVVELPDVRRIQAGSDAPADLAAGWSAEVDEVACGCALLARDDDFADALASGTAQAGGAPLLLTDGEALDAQVVAELERLGITQVTILGGPAAVSEAVAEDLRSRGVDVDRVFGATRIQTAVAIAAGAAGTAEVPLLLRAYGDEANPTAGFADSLAAGRAAASQGRQVLLTDSAGLSPEVAEHLTDRGITEVAIVGGVEAVSEQVVADLDELGITATRVAGDTRFATATAVATMSGAASATEARAVLLLDGGHANAWAEGFAAAGSPLPGPIVLTDGDTIPQPTLDWLGEDAAGEVTLTCGFLVSEAACQQAAARLGLG